MHELSVARTLTDLVCEQIRGTELASQRIAVVRVRVGVMNAIAPQALRSAFKAAAAGTFLESADLIVEPVEPVVWCPKCRQQRLVSDWRELRCPECDTATPRIVQGRELEIASIETATDPVAGMEAHKDIRGALDNSRPFGEL